MKYWDILRKTLFQAESSNTLKKPLTAVAQMAHCKTKLNIIHKAIKSQIGLIVIIKIESNLQNGQALNLKQLITIAYRLCKDLASVPKFSTCI